MCIHIGLHQRTVLGITSSRLTAFTGLTGYESCANPHNPPALGDATTESHLCCTYYQSAQPLTGVYLELFRYIYVRQEMRSCPPKTELDWDVFQPSNRSLQKGGGAKMGNVFLDPDTRKIAFKYLTRCRERIFKTHASGRCPTYQEEVAKRGVPYFTSRFASLSETFKELRNVPEHHWCQGRPALFDVDDVRQV